MDPTAVSVSAQSVVTLSDTMLWNPFRGCKYRASPIQQLTRKSSYGLACPPKTTTLPCQHSLISQEASDTARSEVQHTAICDRRYRGSMRGSEQMIRMLGNICFRTSHFQIGTDADNCTTKQEGKDTDHHFCRNYILEYLTPDEYGKDIDHNALEHEHFKNKCHISNIDTTYSGLSCTANGRFTRHDMKFENRNNNAKDLATYIDREGTDVDRIAARYIDRMDADVDRIAARYIDRMDADVDRIAARYIDRMDADVDRITARYIDRMDADVDRVPATYKDKQETYVDHIAATYIDRIDADVDRIAARYIDRMDEDFDRVPATYKDKQDTYVDHIAATYIDRADTDVDRVTILDRKAGNRSDNASRSSGVHLSSNSNHSRDFLLPSTSQNTNSDVASSRLHGPVQYFPDCDTDFLLYENPGEYIVVNDGTYYGRIIRNPNWNPEPSWKPPWWDSAVSWFSRACVVGVILTFGYVLFQKIRESGL